MCRRPDYPLDRYRLDTEVGCPVSFVHHELPSAVAKVTRVTKLTSIVQQNPRANACSGTAYQGAENGRHSGT